MYKLDLIYRITGKCRRILFRFVNISHFFTIYKLKQIDKKLKYKQQRLSLTVRSDFDFKSIKKSETDSLTFSNFAIIFQGKFFNEDQETKFINNARALRDAYPKIKIIVSTYKEDINNELSFDNLGIKILNCEDAGGLQIPYSPNLSRQIETTINGLKYAKELGIKFAVKMRVDQHVSPVNFIELCLAMINTFTAKTGNECTPTSTHKRIFVTSYNTFRRKPLHISDMLMFGEVESLIIYWKRCPAWNFTCETEKLLSKYPLISRINFHTPEVWLAARYLDSLGYELGDLKIANEYAWRNEFGIIDSAWVGQSWLKSLSFLNTNLATNTWFFSNYFTNDIEDSAELTFKDWWVQYYL
jgi:hypothetical protein